MRGRKDLRYGVGLLTLAIAVAACSGSTATSPPATSQPDAEAAACAAIQTWSDEMRAFTSLDPATASIEDVNAQRQKVDDSWTAIKTSLENVEAADEAAVLQAGAGLETALRTFPTDVPIADAINGVKTAAEPLKASYQEMADGLGCTLTNPY